MPESGKQIIRVKDLNKSFSGIKALDSIQFDLYPGEVHALMGENGAGKSTFMKILMGLILPDSGSINFNGELIENMDVHKMLQKGISMIHQEILMVPELTVAQNIFLGREFKGRVRVDEHQIDQQSQELLNLIGLNLNVKTKAKKLSIAQMQLIEIAK